MLHFTGVSRACSAETFVGGDVKGKGRKERSAGFERKFFISRGTERLVRGGHPSNWSSAQVERRGWKGNSCSGTKGEEDHDIRAKWSDIVARAEERHVSK